MVAKRGKSYLEEIPAKQLDENEIEYVREDRFHKTRRFRLDFYLSKIKLGVEVNGGTFSRGGHSTGVGIRSDYEKNALAAIEGIQILYGDAKQTKSGELLEWILECMETMEGETDGDNCA